MPGKDLLPLGLGPLELPREVMETGEIVMLLRRRRSELHEEEIQMMDMEDQDGHGVQPETLDTQIPGVIFTETHGMPILVQLMEPTAAFLGRKGQDITDASRKGKRVPPILTVV
jgi:hypothetical protein